MSVKATTKWLTVCLHYNEPWEELLIKAVKPYIEVVLQTGVAERLFFQRSWERGPHIRLFFKGNAFILENILKPNLQEHFLQYFDSRPSLLVEPHYPADFPEEYRWLPNNSIHFLPGATELSVFDNHQKLKFCERQLQASSQIILNILKDKTGKWKNHEITSAAIKLHLAFVYAAGLNLGEAQEFFQWMTDEWLTNHKMVETINHEPSWKRAKLHSFQKIFELQKKDIVSYHSALWEIFKNYRKIEDKEFVHWFHVSTSTCIELSLALESGKIQPRQNGPQEEYRNMEIPHIWTYYAAFIHLINNQLGIENTEEGYLLYSLSQSLRTLRQGVPTHARVKV